MQKFSSNHRSIALLKMAFLSGIVLMAFGCRNRSQNENNRNVSKRSDSNNYDLVGKIDGASMAPSLKGVHYSTTCPKCQYCFDFDAKSGIQLEKVHCPLCGSGFEFKKNSGIQSAEQVGIYRSDEIRRWNVIAAKRGDGYSVKRVVGLPGEMVSIKDGDIWINGSPVTKSDEVQRDTRMLMFDSEHPVDRQLHWKPDTINKSFPVSLARDFQIHYCQYPNYSAPTKSDALEPVKDFYGYNQSLSRTLNECADISCEFEIQLPERGAFHDFELIFALNVRLYGSVCFVLEIHDESMDVKVLQNEKRLSASTHKLPSSKERLTCCVGTIDGVARIAFAETKAIDVFLKRVAASDLSNSPHPVVLKYQNNTPEQVETATLRSFKVYRDIYYYQKAGTESWQLGSDQFFVVGDNVPVSRDSRNTGVFPTRADVVGIVGKPIENR